MLLYYHSIHPGISAIPGIITSKNCPPQSRDHLGWCNGDVVLQGLHLLVLLAYDKLWEGDTSCWLPVIAALFSWPQACLSWTVGDNEGDGVNEGCDNMEWQRNTLCSSSTRSVVSPYLILKECLLNLIWYWPSWGLKCLELGRWAAGKNLLKRDYFH